MRKNIVQYMITPEFNRNALRTPGITQPEWTAAIKARQIEALAAMRAPVTAIVEKHGGTVTLDGSGYGVEGHPYQSSCYMIVKAPEAALPELQAVPGTRTERFTNSTFNLPRTF